MFVESLESQWSVQASELSLVGIFWVIWGKMMQTSEAPVFWGYTKLRIARFLYGLKYCIWEKAHCFDNT